MEASRVASRAGRCAALVMAAGAATRFGSQKALLPWHGQSLLRHVVTLALASPCAAVFVVLGANADSLSEHLRDLDITIVRYAGWNEGLGTSIAQGVTAIEGSDGEAFDRILLLLADQPFVTPELLDELFAGQHRRMVASRYGETLGPPVLFDRSCFEKLRALEGDRGAKTLLMQERESVACVAFPDGQFDIDTPQDYERAIEIFSNKMSGTTSSTPKQSSHSEGSSDADVFDSTKEPGAG